MRKRTCKNQTLWLLQCRVGIVPMKNTMGCWMPDMTYTCYWKNVTVSNYLILKCISLQLSITTSWKLLWNYENVIDYFLRFFIYMFFMITLKGQRQKLHNTERCSVPPFIIAIAPLQSVVLDLLTNRITEFTECSLMQIQITEISRGPTKNQVLYISLLRRNRNSTK